ncbi:hypothetical protein [Hyella patelloides]|uniref:hypothetical protein n=1 Tax=Hyella patelloides TaxID=1982969 RepID=UPI001643CCD9|nr:hypothetical protein [Hyella patelloides]
MPKKAYLAPHYSNNELKRRYLNSSSVKESRRWHLNRENSSRVEYQSTTKQQPDELKS